MAITWTQEEIDELKAAIAKGVLTVKYGGPPSREVTYRSLDEMLALLSQMESSVGGRTSFRRVRFRQGFRDGDC